MCVAPRTMHPDTARAANLGNCTCSGRAAMQSAWMRARAPSCAVKVRHGGARPVSGTQPVYFGLLIGVQIGRQTDGWIDGWIGRRAEPGCVLPCALFVERWGAEKIATKYMRKVVFIYFWSLFYVCQINFNWHAERRSPTSWSNNAK